MSTHTYEEHSTYDGAARFLRAASCGCGWKSENVYGEAMTSELARDMAMRDYVEHVEQTLGTNSRYKALAACTQCGWQGEASAHVGLALNTSACPRCGIKGQVKPDNEFARLQERERARSRSMWGF